MADNKKLKGKPDRMRVDIHDTSETQRLYKQFPHLSRQAVTGAIQAAGPMRSNIIAYLRKRW